jgi:hypothetical protein
MSRTSAPDDDREIRLGHETQWCARPIVEKNGISDKLGEAAIGTADPFLPRDVATVLIFVGNRFAMAL